ncbi:TPA: Ig-like domain-containing protein, partial [Streptococcus suis]
GTITKAVGESVTAEEILNNVTINPGNEGAVINDAADPKFRKVLAPDQQVPTTPGTHTVKVRVITDSNVYKDVPVTVVIPNPPATATNKQDIYVFKNSPIQTVNPTTNVADNTNKVKIADLTDPQGIKQAEVIQIRDSLGYTVDAEGNASGTVANVGVGSYKRELAVTDNLDGRTVVLVNGNPDQRFTTYVMDVTADTTPVAFALGDTLESRTADILNKVSIDPGTKEKAHIEGTTDNNPKYTKVLAPGQTLPTTPGDHTITVRVITDSNVYKDVEVPITIPANTAPTVRQDIPNQYVWKGTAVEPAINANVQDVNSTPERDDISRVYFSSTDSTADLGNPGAVSITKDTAGNYMIGGTPVGEAGYTWNRKITAVDKQNATGQSNAFNINILDSRVKAEINKPANAEVTAAEVLEQVEVLSRTVETDKTHDITTQLANDGGVTKKVLTDLSAMPKTGRQTVRVELTTPSEHKKIEEVIVNYPNVPTDVTAPTDIYTWANTDLTSPIVLSAKDAEGISSFKFKNTGNNLDGPVSGLTISNPVLSDDKYTATITGKYANSSAGNVVTRRIDATDTDGNVVRAGNNTVIRAIDITGGTMETRSLNNPVTEQEIKEFVATKLNLGGQTDPGVVYELVENQTLPTSGQNNTVRVKAKIPNPTVSNGFQEKIVDVIVNYPNVPTDVTAPTDIYTWANTDLTSPIVLSAKDVEGISSFKFKNTSNNLDGPVSGLNISSPVLSGDKYTATIAGKYANSSAGNRVTRRIDATDTDGNIVRAGNNTVIHAIDITGGTMETRSTTNPVTEQEIKDFVAAKLNLGGQTDPGVVYELVENQTLPTSGQNNTVRVRAKIPNPTVSNGFQEKIVDVTVNYDDPVKPSVTPKDDGRVEVFPPSDENVKSVTTTYTDENDQTKTVTATKGEDGNWTVPADSGVTVDPTTGVVTIPADSVKDDSTVTAKSNNGFVDSEAVTGTAKKDPTTADKTEPNKPAVTEVADPTNLTDAEKAKVKEEVKKANPDLPKDTEVEVGNDGTVTVTYPDKSTDEIPGTETATTDKTAPVAPVITTDLTDKAGTRTPITVTAEPNAKVELFDKDGNKIGEGTADENGTVTITPTSEIPAGNVTAKATDKAGNVSDASAPK